MEGDHSVTQLIAQVKNGNRLAADALFRRYYPEMVKVARARLRGLRGAAVDEEDVALSAFERFRGRAACGALEELTDRNDLWYLLIKIICNKASDEIKAELTLKRGGGNVLDEGALEGLAGSTAAPGIAQIAGTVDTPELNAMLTEELHQRLDSLPDDRCRAVAQMRLEGWRVTEIAEQLDCPKRVVERLLNLIRAHWSRERAS